MVSYEKSDNGDVGVRVQLAVTLMLGEAISPVFRHRTEESQPINVAGPCGFDTGGAT